jgi:short-subunit dehydrogenase
MSQATKAFALVIGASSGNGAICADRLAKRDYDLILVARRVDRLRTLVDKVAGETGRKAEVIAADLVKRKEGARSRPCCEPTSGSPPSSTTPASVRPLPFFKPTWTR